MSSKLNKHRAKSADDDSDDDSEDDISLDDDDPSFTDSRWDGLKDVAVDED